MNLRSSYSFTINVLFPWWLGTFRLAVQHSAKGFLDSNMLSI